MMDLGTGSKIYSLREKSQLAFSSSAASTSSRDTSSPDSFQSYQNWYKQEIVAQDGLLDASLAAKLVKALLAAVLFDKGQIPMTLQQLERQALREASSSLLSSSSSQQRADSAFLLTPKPSLSQSLLTQLSQLSDSLIEAFSTLARIPHPSPKSDASSSGMGVDAPPLVVLLSGPSLLLPRALFAIRLPLLGVGLDGENGEQERGGNERRTNDAIERSVLRGLVHLGSLSGQSLAPTKTFLLLLAPRSFRSPLFLPRQNLSARLGTLLAPAPTPYAASAKGQERKATTTSRIATEGVTLELDETDVGTIRVERGVGRSGLEKGEEDERIWFVWEGGTLNGWRD